MGVLQMLHNPSFDCGGAPVRGWFGDCLMFMLRCWLCLFLWLGCAWLLPAQAGERGALIVAGLDKQIYLPVRLAAQLGYFRDQELEVELLSEPSGANAEDVLLVGGAQGVVGAYHHTLDLQARGKAAQSVVLFTLSPGEVELVAARQAGAISSPADWKGRRLGVTGLSSVTHVLTHALALRQGLKPQDYTVLPVGSGPAFAAALREGRIDGGMSSEPLASGLVQSGEARVLVDLRTPEATQKALGQSRAMFSADGLMPEDGPQQVQRLAALVNRPQRERRLDLGRTFTNQFVRQANASLGPPTSP